MLYEIRIWFNRALSVMHLIPLPQFLKVYTRLEADVTEKIIHR
jgi:hypothetical protein